MKENITLTAHQYLTAISKLPNPLYYFSGEIPKTPVMKIALLKEEINTDTIFVATDVKTYGKTASIIELTFQLVPNKNVWYWQPIQPVTIMPIEVGAYKTERRSE